MPKKTILVLLLALLVHVQFLSQTQARTLERFTVRVHVPSIEFPEKENMFSRGNVKGRLSTFVITLTHPGNGDIRIQTKAKTLLDLNASARIAFEVAGYVTFKDMSKYDVKVELETRAKAVGGPSGSAGITIGIIAALLGVQVKQDAAITGTILPDGTIGPVGYVVEKASGVSEAGLASFVIPSIEAGAYMDGLSKHSLSEEIREKYGLKVYEASNVWEAFEYMTGYVLMKPKPETMELNTLTYREILEPEAREMLHKAEESLEALKHKYHFIGRRVKGISGEQLEERISSLERKIEKTNQLITDGKLYSALSYGFQVLLESKQLLEKINYYSTGDSERGKYLGELLRKVESKIEKDYKLVTTESKLESLVQLQCQAAAEERIINAMVLLREAKEKIENGETEEGLNLLVYARERSNTAVWWKNFKEKFEVERGRKINAKLIKSLTDGKKDYANLLAQYLRYLANETEAPEIKEAIYRETEENMEKINEAYERGLYVSALFEALDAISNQNMLMGVLIPVFSRKDFAEKIALKSMEEAAASAELVKENEVEPLLPIFHYEFGSTYLNTSPHIAFEQFTLSILISQELLKIKMLSGGQTSFPEVKPIPLKKEEVEVGIERKRENLFFVEKKVLRDIVIPLICLLIVAVIIKMIKDELRKPKLTFRPDYYSG